MDDTRVFTFKKSAFREMTIDVVGNQTGCLEMLPILASFPEFQDPGLSVSYDSIIRYIVLMYDPRTPLTTRINDLPSRKFNALYYAGIYQDSLTNKFPEDVMLFSQCLLPSVNSMIFRYARFVWNDDYATLMVLQQSYDRLLAQGFSSSKDFEASQGLREQITKLHDKLLNKDSSTALQQDFFDYLEEERLNIRPEEIAEALHNGVDPLPFYINPYQLSTRKKIWISQVQK